MNMNDFAVRVAKLEGKKVNQSIGQIKETIKITLTLLGKENDSDVLKVINRYRSKKKK